MHLRFWAFAAAVLAGSAFAAPPLRIARRSAGPVRLGMRLGDLKRLPGITVKRTRDGEGLALVEVSRGREEWMTVYADEPDPDEPINSRAKINNIEVTSPQFATAEGVRPGMKIGEVERRYGRLKEVRRSEIESRWFASFVRGPKWMTFRITAAGGLAGVYGKGAVTRKTAAGARLASITIAGP